MQHPKRMTNDGICVNIALVAGVPGSII